VTYRVLVPIGAAGPRTNDITKPTRYFWSIRLSSHRSTSVISFACLSARALALQVLFYFSFFLCLCISIAVSTHLPLCNLLALCGSSISSPTLLCHPLSASPSCRRLHSLIAAICSQGYPFGCGPAPASSFSMHLVSLLLKVLEALVQLTDRASADPDITYLCRASITKAIINCQQVRKHAATEN
jgi:hypothetical protein